MFGGEDQTEKKKKKNKKIKQIKEKIPKRTLKFI